jgi:hypothetical protein
VAYPPAVSPWPSAAAAFTLAAYSGVCPAAVHLFIQVGPCPVPAVLQQLSEHFEKPSCLHWACEVHAGRLSQKSFARHLPMWFPIFAKQRQSIVPGGGMNAHVTVTGQISAGCPWQGSRVCADAFPIPSGTRAALRTLAPTHLKTSRRDIPLPSIVDIESNRDSVPLHVDIVTSLSA